MHSQIRFPEHTCGHGSGSPYLSIYMLLELLIAYFTKFISCMHTHVVPYVVLDTDNPGVKACMSL